MTRDHLLAGMKAIARNFDKSDYWAKDSLNAWWVQLKDYSDQDMNAAIAEALRTRKRCPTVATMISLIEANPQKTPKQAIEGCGACEDTGQREIAKWTTRGGSTLVLNYIAACSCPKGQTLSRGAYADYRDVQREWEADPYVDKVYVSDATVPKLPLWQRVDPETLERLKVPKDMQPPPGAWQRLATVER